MSTTSKEPVAERTKILSCRVTPDFHKQAKLAAVNAEVGLDEFVREAIMEKMSNGGKK